MRSRIPVCKSRGTCRCCFLFVALLEREVRRCGGIGCGLRAAIRRSPLEGRRHEFVDQIRRCADCERLEVMPRFAVTSIRKSGLPHACV